jgi:sensor c-di-GMP phosphodiesterase-like protein
VRGAIDIARGLNLQVIAEGVETDIQRDQLIMSGARYGQGFLFGAAMPLPETLIRLAAEATRPPPDAFVPGLALPRVGGQANSGKAR